MKEQPLNNEKNSFAPPSKTLIKIYEILAIVLVITPEWIAEIILWIRNSFKSNLISKGVYSSNVNPEVKLALMTMKELRDLALRLKIKEYSREPRISLSKRLLKKMRSSSKI